MNGIPINDGESQVVMFVNFPDLLSSTHSIQVQRGVGSSTNGASAFGASVNLSTLEQRDMAYGEIASGYGSFNTLKNTIKAGTGLLKQGFQFDVRLSKLHSDGYIERSASDLKALQLIAGWRSQDERSSLKFNLLTGKEKTEQAWGGVPEDSLKTNRRYNGLGLMPNGDFYKDQTDNYQQDYYQLFFNHQINHQWDLHLATFLTRGRGFYNEYRLDQPFADYAREPYVTPSNDTLNTTNLIWQDWLDNYYYGLTYALNYQKEVTKFNLGGSLSRYTGDHFSKVTWAEYGFPADYTWQTLPAYKNDFSIFGKLEQGLGKGFNLYGDLQYRYVNYLMKGFRNNPELEPHVLYHFFNPKVGLSYVTTHRNHHMSKAFASFAMAQKEPNRDDFEANSSQQPRPEVLYDWEVGYQYKAHDWQFDLTAYYMNYKDQLILTGKINEVGSYSRQNVASSFRRGIELVGSYVPANYLSLSANASLAQNKVRNFSEYIDDYDNGGQIENNYDQTDISFSPNFIAYGQASLEPFAGKWQQQQFFIDLTAKHLGRQFLDNTSNKARSINPYSLLDLQFRYYIRPKFIKEIKLGLGVINLLDQRYASNGYTFSYAMNQQLNTENYFYPQAGRHFLFDVRLSF